MRGASLSGLEYARLVAARGEALAPGCKVQSLAEPFAAHRGVNVGVSKNSRCMFRWSSQFSMGVRREAIDPGNKVQLLAEPFASQQQAVGDIRCGLASLSCVYSLLRG